MLESERGHSGDSDASAVNQLLDERQLLVVSNREPYSHEYDDGDIAISCPAGGLTAAVDPMMQSLGGTWVAWGSGDADQAVVDERDHVEVPPDAPAYELRRVWLDEQALQGYYYGYSNQVLWPICHGLPSKVKHTDAFWQWYRQVNERFADAITQEVDQGDPVVWLHDYHLGLAPRLVRRRLRQDVLLGHFWHIPWPPWDIFRRCPHGREILTALLSNDLLGFHTDHDRRHFVRCTVAMLDAAYDRVIGEVAHDGRRTLVRTGPIRIDADAFAKRARSEAAEASWQTFAGKHCLDGVRVALGVDRLDYTKGIEERLDALERLWEQYPEWQSDLTYVQKASESRSQIDEYQSLQRRVETRIEEINNRFGTEDWQPIVYINGLVSQTELGALYRHADIALVSPIRDGLNLVAKEYVASQVDNDGVLVLSDTAGVRETLGDDALFINPLDIGSFERTVRRALEMPDSERRHRMESLRERVHETDPHRWVEELFRDLASEPSDRPQRVKEWDALVE